MGSRDTGRPHETSMGNSASEKHYPLRFFTLKAYVGLVRTLAVPTPVPHFHIHDPSVDFPYSKCVYLSSH